VKFFKNKLTGRPRISFSQSKCEKNLGEDKAKPEYQIDCISRVSLPKKYNSKFELRKHAALWKTSRLWLHYSVSSYLKTSLYFFPYRS